jgi:putative oxidoreductase
MDMGLLIIRAVLGAFFVGHGTQKLFGWFRGHGLDGTGQFLEGLGYVPGRRHAALAGIAETGGGLLLVLGFLTPLGAAAVIGVMVNAIVTVHWPNGVWDTEGGIEYPVVAAAAAACLAYTGAGAVSFDALLDNDFGGGLTGTTAVAVGCLAAAIVLASRQFEELEEPEQAADLVRGEAEVTASRAEVADR